MDLSVSWRAGLISAFALTAQIGNDAALRGELRTTRDGHRSVYLEADDAGAFLKFMDLFGKLSDGRMWMALELPSSGQALQKGVFNVRDFRLVADPAFKALSDMLTPPSPPEIAPVGSPVRQSRLRAEFAVAPGKLVIDDALLHLPFLGAMLAGKIDADVLDLRGVFLPSLYVDAHMVPCTPRGCLYGIPFTITGSILAPQIQINPFMSGPSRKLLDPP